VESDADGFRQIFQPGECPFFVAIAYWPTGKEASTHNREERSGNCDDAGIDLPYSTASPKGWFCMGSVLYAYPRKADGTHEKLSADSRSQHMPQAVFSGISKDLLSLYASQDDLLAGHLFPRKETLEWNRRKRLWCLPQTKHRLVEWNFFRGSNELFSVDQNSAR
jgi:hypothetical protein